MRGNTARIELLEGNILKTIDLNSSTTKLINSFLRPHYPGDIEPIVAHEVKALEILAKYDISPIVKKYGKDFIVMSYVGEEAKSVSAEQVNHIVSILTKADIIHNDLVFNEELRNITILNGRVYLIDFQLASMSGIPSVKDIRKAFWRPNYESDEKQLREMI